MGFPSLTEPPSCTPHPQTLSHLQTVACGSLSSLPPKPSHCRLCFRPLHTSQTMAPQVGNWISSSLRPRSSAKPCRVELKKMFLAQC